MPYTDEEIREALSHQGVGLDDYFLLDDTIMYLGHMEGEDIATPFALVIEDDLLWEACRDFLAARGARRFRSWSEFEAWRHEHHDRPPRTRAP